MKLETGARAPQFKGQDQDGNEISLARYAGRWLLLYFYPKDFTPGCTTEACSLRDKYGKLKERLSIVGVSADSAESHRKFSEKYQLPFALLADPERETIKRYGADGIIFSKRVSFLISPDGVIKKIYDAVKPAEHAGEILHDLAAWQ